MSVANVRIGKELRALTGLWCALTVFGALFFLPIRLVRFSEPFFLSVFTLCFWVGLPLLATLSMGHEFQHRTASLLFSQPIDRIKIWREKWIVLVPAMATASFLYIWTDVGMGIRLGHDWQTQAIALVWIVTATCTAPFWTLVGRSILNGLVLNLIQGFLMFWMWVGVSSVFDPGHILSVCLIAATGYAFLMLWLGRRKFVHFEVSGGSASADLLVPGSGTTSRSGGLLRSRPGQPILNLVRKEVRLLWLVWVLVIASVLGVLCLAALQFVPGYTMNKVGFWTSAFVFSLSLLSGILAGSLSMGEERTSGTQSWHRTLPVAGTTQWLVKLGVVLAVSFLALAFPLMVARFAVGENLVFPTDIGLGDHPVLALFIFSSLFTFAAFWCACAVKGTVRAALLTIPAVAVVFVALRLGISFVQSFQFTFLLDTLILRLHPVPFGQRVQYFLGLRDWVIVLPLIVAVIQSYRLFRRELEDHLLPALKPLLEVALVAFLFGIAGLLPSFVVFRADRLLDTALRETSDVVATFNPKAIRPEMGKPLQLTLEDIEKLYWPLSDASRTLLRDATVVVSRNSASRFSYSTVVRFRNGLVCTADGPRFQRCEMQGEK